MSSGYYSLLYNDVLVVNEKKKKKKLSGLQRFSLISIARAITAVTRCYRGKIYDLT